MAKIDTYFGLIDDSSISKIKRMQSQGIATDTASDPVLHFNPALLNHIYQKLKESFFCPAILSISSDKDHSFVKESLEKYLVDVLAYPSDTFALMIERMDQYAFIDLMIGKDLIHIIFVQEDRTDQVDRSDNIQKMIDIVHALKTFCSTFEGSYDGLNLIVVLDKTKRIVPDDLKNVPLKERIRELQKRYLALNVSGVTYSANKLIILTKTEEVVKLMFHELIHFVKWDDLLRSVVFRTDWGLKADQRDLNLSEAYTEFLAIIVYLMYATIPISILYQRSWTDVFQTLFELELEHSIYLTAKVLTFFGFDSSTNVSFFGGSNRTKLDQPIYLAEYVICRSLLMMRAQKIMDMVVSERQTSLKIPQRFIPDLLSMIKDDDMLVEKIDQYIRNVDDASDNSLSYLALDLSSEKINRMILLGRR